MSETYRAVGWNRQKIIYDGIMMGAAALYLMVFIGLGALFRPNATAETLLIRGFGTLAFVMLHVVLIIGPLCRISPKFLPLLYNRRHLGVATFIFGSAHGVFALFQFHALGNVNPLVSLLISNTRYTSIPDFPFQVLGALALLILFVMAATSHDFWLKNLTAPVWKTIHTFVYVAYALLVGHVLLGVLQAETNILLAVALGTGIFLVVALHITAAFKEARQDEESESSVGFADICAMQDIPENRARIGTVSGERVAVFRTGGEVYAVSNVCQHQNGPLGEGKIVDGCITCPWHGFQYDPKTGASPPPFKEKIPTFDVKIEEGRVLVKTIPNPPGSRAGMTGPDREMTRAANGPNSRDQADP
ncbi:MAG: (2Fe-2S)-binding protein [Acidobacteria bacterium]|nr:MAG: (2Fe-2S)-binding protein [Acidobacteriota bacterium]REK02852.1 MAG: (2Fe-2S)-binding protein [Acidobacteriota bacterium]REK13344.1 MAG: (2Fe-2S)-binding protein [Acidobacteriota bacterium]REK41338.1 MAG: (2Fe-2S)-binding protein [Acidobacteriota bacterium]